MDHETFVLLVERDIRLVYNLSCDERFVHDLLYKSIVDRPHIIWVIISLHDCIKYDMAETEARALIFN